MVLATLFKVAAYISALSGVLGSKSCRQDSVLIYSCNHVPKEIPAGVREFRLEIETSGILSFNSSTIVAESWSGLKILRITETHHTDILFNDNSFNGLQSLEELYIHVWNPGLFENTFFGLLNVEKLDLSGCAKLTVGRLKMSLSGLDILPRMQKLVLTDWNIYKGLFAFNGDFVETLLPRNISFIDLSKSQLSFLDWNSVIHLKDLKVLNLSYAIISDWSDDKVTPKDMEHIKEIDMSHAVLPLKVVPLLPGKYVVSNFAGSLSMVRSNDYRKFLAVETLNLTGLITHLSSLWFYNVTCIADVDPLLFNKYIKIRQNNLKRLDVRFVCDKFYASSIEFIDISDNGLEFLHPTFSRCFRNIVHLHISKNELYKMFNENEIMFENLISELKYLKTISISENGLQNIPNNFFSGSRSIEEIDLSNNKLKQVLFDLSNLDELKVLNLEGNDIHILKSDSIHHLNSISSHRNIRISKANIYMQSNPISCSDCSAKSFLKWILTTNLINRPSQNLKCIGENGEQCDINRDTLNIVDSICKRKVIVISSSITSVILLISVIVVVLVFYKRHKRKLKEKKTAQVINNLREGEGQFQFAVFLSYSSEDEDFVKANIHDQMNENLQLMTGIDRELVSTGDINFRPGFYIHDEIDKLIESASVVIVVVSNSFINSNYSCNEVNQAYKHGKPIILMLIEHVEEGEIEKIPVMKTLFKRNVRILWTVENGEPVLKTTWENVSRSILDLIEFRNQ